MPANELPLDFILQRSVSDRLTNPDNLELDRLSISQTEPRRELEPEQEQKQDEKDIEDNSLNKNHIPLSKDPSIYYQKIGLTSTQRSRPSKLNTINSTLSRNGSAVRRGYGLDDFSTSEEEDENDDNGNTDSDDDEYLTSDSEDEAFPVSSRRYANPGKQPSDLEGRNTELAHYVAHITGRIDPWELKMQRVQEEGRHRSSQTAEKIASDFKKLSTASTKPATISSWNPDDVAQRLKAMDLETEAIKEKRKKETEAKNQAMAKEIENCLARIKDERETAIRIREEALRKIREEEERKVKEAEEKEKASIAQKEAQQKKATEEAEAKAERAKKAAAAAAEKRATDTSAIFVSEAANAEYQRYTKVLDHIRTRVLPAVTGNPPLKKFCFGARRDIVASIGQLINKRQEVIRVATEIDNYFKTAKNHSEDAYSWVLNCTAKKLVKQAETEALVKCAPTFPLAHVAVLLFTNHPLFHEVLMSRFAKKCHYVTPMYIQKEPNDSPEDYLRKLAYKSTGKGFESEAQYNARQCAMFTLYCAILQTTSLMGQNLHPMSYGWTWMARIMNMPPRPITPALIAVFLEVCGNSYLRTYRNQANKVLALLYNEFLQMVPQQGVDGKTRLKILLDDFLKTGQIPLADGQGFDG
ncbi:hypothetical protein BGZ76_009032 [Entomortierella beljakovae]|nr:hypothetical protein BGZ76_009032 [Entomortierella beljakovae]